MYLFCGNKFPVAKGSLIMFSNINHCILLKACDPSSSSPNLNISNKTCLRVGESLFLFEQTHGLHRSLTKTKLIHNNNQRSDFSVVFKCSVKIKMVINSINVDVLN